jgi:hypothetical protein
LAYQNQTFLEEALSAVRGCWALVTGRQDAARYFDFTQRGLVGSFIALVLATGISVFGPALLGVPSQAGAATSAVLLAAMLFALQIAAAYIVLRQMGRLDGLIPFIVADNWVNFVVSLFGTVVLVLLGGSDVMLFAVGIISIIVEINIARRILTLSPMQVATFIVVQIVAQLIGLLILGGVMLQSMPAMPAA